jgi:hypothetical protein
VNGRYTRSPNAAQPPRPSRCHHDPHRLPARPESRRANGPAMGPGRVHLGKPARPQGEARNAEHASGPCDDFNEISSQNRPSSLRQNEARRSPRQVLHG